MKQGGLTMKLKNRRDVLNKMLYKELKDDEWIKRELDEMIGTSNTEETRQERYDYFCRYQATAYVAHFRRVLATEGKRSLFQGQRCKRRDSSMGGRLFKGGN